MPGSGGASVSGHLLDEARGLRRLQDERLRVLQTLSRSMLAGFLSAALIAVAARPAAQPIGSALGLGIASAAALLAFISLLVDFMVSRWREGPDVRKLYESFGEASDTEHFETLLALTHDEDRRHNEVLLVGAKRIVALQVVGTVGGAGTLLALFLDIA